MMRTHTRALAAALAGILLLDLAVLATHDDGRPDPLASPGPGAGASGPDGAIGEAGTQPGPDSAATTSVGPVGRTPGPVEPGGPPSSAPGSSGSSGSSGSPAPTSRSSGSSSTTTPRGAVRKPTMAGLVDREGLPSLTERGFVKSFVVQVRWAQLQPAPGQLSTGFIDAALAQAPAGARVKLRLFAGRDSPAWAMALDGPPLRLTHPEVRGEFEVPRFWGPRFGQAYAALQALLAARYDANPLVAEVSTSRCMTVYAETMLRQLTVGANADAYRASGFTPELDERCLTEQLEAHLVWKQTSTGLALNPYQRLLPDGQVRVDADVGRSLMERCRSLLGSRCVLENNSVRWPLLGGGYPAMYEQMRALGGPITVQTETPERIGSWADALRWSAEYLGASAVELPHSYEGYDRALLITLGQAFLRNASL